MQEASTHLQGLCRHQLPSAVVQGRVDVDTHVVLQQAAECLQNAAIQIRVVHLVKQVLHRMNCQAGLSSILSCMYISWLRVSKQTRMLRPGATGS